MHATCDILCYKKVLAKAGFIILRIANVRCKRLLLCSLRNVECFFLAIVVQKQKHKTENQNCRKTKQNEHTFKIKLNQTQPKQGLMGEIVSCGHGH